MEIGSLSLHIIPTLLSQANLVFTVTLKLNLGKSHCAVHICYSVLQFWFQFIWKSTVHCSSFSLLTVRTTCAGVFLFCFCFFMAKD